MSKAAVGKAGKTVAGKIADAVGGGGPGGKQVVTVIRLVRRSEHDYEGNMGQLIGGTYSDSYPRCVGREWRGGG